MKNVFNILIIMFLRFGEITVYFFDVLFPAKRKTKQDADFIRVTKIASRFNKSFSVNGCHYLSQHAGTMHVICIGNSGSRKSSSILLPSIINMRKHASQIINNPAFELHTLASGVLHRDGTIIKTLSYADPQKSVGYNPLHRAKTVSEIKKVCKILVVQSLGTGGKDPFWNLAAENLLAMVIQYLIENTEEQHHNLYNAYHLLCYMSYAPPEEIDKLFVTGKKSGLLREYKSFLANSANTNASILATAKAAIAIFGTDEAVAMVTSHDNLSFEDFRKHRTALFINTSVPDMRYYSVITSVLLEQFFGYMMRTPVEKGDLPIAFLIDEASSLYFSQLQITVSNLRKSNGSILLCFQSQNQLIDLYTAPVAKALMDNCGTKIYMPNQSMETAKELENVLGKFEFEEHGNLKTRSLKTAAEIRELQNKAIVVRGHFRPVLTKVRPYFRRYSLRQLVKIPAFQPESDVPFETPPLLQFLQYG